MNCSNCTKTLEIPQCTDNLIIGQSDFKDTDVYIFIKDEESRIQREEGTTDGDGVVSLDMSSPANYYQSGVNYELSVTLRDTNSTELLNIQIGGGTFTCFQLSVSGIFNTIEAVNYTSQDLQLDEEFTEVSPLFDNANKGFVQEFDSTDVRVWEDQNGLRDASQTTASLQPTLNGSLLELDGGDFLVIPDFTFSTSFLHVMALFRNDGGSPIFADFQDIITQYNGLNTAEQSWALYIDADNDDIYFDIISGSLIKNRTIQVLTVRDEWILVEGIFNAGELDLFANKLVQPNSSYQDDTITALVDVASDVVIGSQADFSFVFKGDYQAVKAWDSILSPTQRQREQLKMLAMI